VKVDEHQLNAVEPRLTALKRQLGVQVSLYSIL
jgi:hypothetical protein